MEKESNQMQPEPVWPILPHVCLPSFHTTSQGECNSSVDCNTQFDMLAPIIVTNEPKTFNDAPKDAIVKDYEFLDLYTAKKRENVNISHSVDHKANKSDNLNFPERPLQSHTDETELYEVKSEQILRPMVPSQSLAPLSSCLPSFHTLLNNSSFDCNTEKILVQREYGNDILKGEIVTEEDFLDPFTTRFAKYFHNKYINHIVSGEANVLDNPNFVAASYMNRLQSTTFELEMQPQTKNASATDVENNLLQKNGNIGIELRINQLPLVKGSFQLSTPTVYSQDIIKEATDGLSYDKHNRKTGEDDDVSGSNNKENFDIMNSHVKSEKKSIQSPEIQRGKLHASNYKKSKFKAKRSLHDHKGRPFVCNVCAKGFIHRTHLLQHSYIHTGERPFVCNVCQKAFTQRNGLVHHSYTHTGEKPFACNVCQKAFSQRSSLLLHSYTHTGEKPFVCNVCQKGFSQSGSLRHHSYTHSGGIARPFVCNVCAKGFIHKNHLQNHSYIHTGERPFECKVCGKYFRQKCNLVRHSKSHIDKKMD